MGIKKKRLTSLSFFVVSCEKKSKHNEQEMNSFLFINNKIKKVNNQSAVLLPVNAQSH